MSRIIDITMLGRRTLYQPSLWGDTYLTPQEAAVYLNQMLMTLRSSPNNVRPTKPTKHNTEK